MEKLKSFVNDPVVNILRALNVPVEFIEPDGKFLSENENAATCRYLRQNKYFVYIRNGLSIAKQQKALCHELGHIAL